MVIIDVALLTPVTLTLNIYAKSKWSGIILDLYRMYAQNLVWILSIVFPLVAEQGLMFSKKGQKRPFLKGFRLL